MNELDYALLAVLALSALLGLLRGFVKEAFSLAGWVFAFWGAAQLARPVATRLQGSVGEFLGIQELPLALAFVAGFAVLLLVAALAGRLLAGVVRASPLSGLDRSLGLVFGLLRGLVLLLAVVVLGGLTPVVESVWWQDSQVVAILQALARWLLDAMGLQVESWVPV